MRHEGGVGMPAEPIRAEVQNRAGGAGGGEGRAGAARLRAGRGQRGAEGARGQAGAGAARVQEAGGRLAAGQGQV